MEKETVTQIPDGIREDLWWITNPVLHASCMMVAQQFVHDTEQPKSREDFVEKATYTLRQLCPITYSYFFQQAGVERLPQGTVEIMVSLIRRERPLFMEGL